MGTVFSLAIFITVGILLFVNVFGKLDGQRDSDWSADANATVTGVEGDFYDGVDLLRVAIIIVPIVAVIGYLAYMKFR